MIDFILFVFMVFVYAFGFWCGKKFGSFTVMCERAQAWIKS